MKKLVLSLVISLGLSVSANAYDSCSSNMNFMFEYINKATKAMDLALYNELTINYKMAFYYSKQVMLECPEGTESFNKGKQMYEILKAGME